VFFAQRKGCGVGRQDRRRGNLQILEKIFFLITILKIIFLYDTVVSDEKVPGPARENQKVRQEGKYRSKQTGTVRKT